MSRLVVLCGLAAVVSVRGEDQCCYTGGCTATQCSVGYCAESETNCKGCGGTFCPDHGPSPSPTPPSPPSPPSPPAPPTPSGDVIGYWDTTWSPVSAPQGANLGIAFSGWNNPQNALSESVAVRGSLVGDKWIDAGGGGLNGRWNAAWLSKWESLIKSGGLKDWAGIVLDVEECFDAGLAQGFADVLRAAKAAGMGTMVTTSHSAPYMCTDAKALMQSFFTSKDCDYLSPQLYAESGDLTKPSFVVTSGAGVEWSDWVGAIPRFAPSLTKSALAHGGYAATQKYFKALNIPVHGYVEWPTTGSRKGLNSVIV